MQSAPPAPTPCLWSTAQSRYGTPIPPPEVLMGQGVHAEDSLCPHHCAVRVGGACKELPVVQEGHGPLATPVFLVV